MDANQLQTLIETINASRDPAPLNRAVWSAREVGAYMKVTPRQVTERWSNLPGFPKAKRLPSANGRGNLRWQAMDVIKWWERQ